MNPLMLKVDLPWWTPPADYLGRGLDKPYWMFTYMCPDGSGFIQAIHGMN